jgi:hypothetical protein
MFTAIQMAFAKKRRRLPVGVHAVASGRSVVSDALLGAGVKLVSRRPIAIAQSMTRQQLVEWVREQEVCLVHSIARHQCCSPGAVDNLQATS